MTARHASAAAVSATHLSGSALVVSRVTPGRLARDAWACLCRSAPPLRTCGEFHQPKDNALTQSNPLEQAPGPDNPAMKAPAPGAPGRSTPVQGRAHLVVVGGGVAGLEVATRLARKWQRKNNAPRITLVDHDSAHVWKPMLHTIAAGTRDISQQQTPTWHRRITRGLSTSQVRCADWTVRLARFPLRRCWPPTAGS